jgi:hypothetical protein
MHMKRNTTKYLFFSVISITFLSLVGCNEFNAPSDVWNPNVSYSTNPTVANVLPLNSAGVSGLPLNSAIAGVREITLIGKFSKNIDSNWVYCGTDLATIKSISENADTLVIYRPPGNGTYINVVTPAAKSLVKYTYSLENPLLPFDISGLGTYIVMESGQNDTVWMALQGYIYKVSPSGQGLPILFKDTSYFKPLPIASSPFRKPFGDIKFGPKGSLYLTLIGTGPSQRAIYCVNPDSSRPVVYTNALTKTATDTTRMVYDGNGNFYIGIKSSGLFLVRGTTTSVVATSVASTGSFSAFPFTELRIFNGYLYASNWGTIVRSLINTDNTVDAAKISVLDLSTQTDPVVRGSTITSFSIGNDGTIFVALSNNSNYSLYVLENGSLTPYYHDTTILPTGVPSGIDQLLWRSDSRFMYLGRGRRGLATSVRLNKVGMAKNDGTPLNGGQ